MTQKRFDLIVFDWDGTLMDSADTIVHCLQAACRDIGIEPPPDQVARHVIGLGLIEALQQMLPSLASERYDELVERYRVHFLAGDVEVPLFDGIAATIEQLHGAGYWLAIATGKSRRGLERALGQTQLGAFFHASRCADECASKPDPLMLNELLREFDVEPERALMIGDTSHDLLMARNAGVPCLAVSYGAHAADALQALAPLACVGGVAELDTWLRQNA